MKILVGKLWNDTIEFALRLFFVDLSFLRVVPFVLHRIIEFHYDLNFLWAIVQTLDNPRKEGIQINDKQEGEMYFMEFNCSPVTPAVYWVECVYLLTRRSSSILRV